MMRRCTNENQSQITDTYKTNRIDWDEYARRFLDLIRRRRVEKTGSKEILSGGCLLCSEAKPHYCHRRLMAEYLSEHWGDIRVSHL